jgi:SET domain-containing protein
MYAGCFTRFLNHACYPNCHIVPCLFGDADFDIPYLAFYTRIPIQKDEEITFSYKGYTDVSPEEEAAARKRAAAKKLFKKVTQKPGTETRIHALCQCGSWNCNGSMFKTGSEDEEETDSELEGLPSEDSEP